VVVVKAVRAATICNNERPIPELENGSDVIPARWQTTDVVVVADVEGTIATTGQRQRRQEQVASCWTIASLTVDPPTSAWLCANSPHHSNCNGAFTSLISPLPTSSQLTSFQLIWVRRNRSQPRRTGSCGVKRSIFRRVAATNHSALGSDENEVSWDDVRRGEVRWVIWTLLLICDYRVCRQHRTHHVHRCGLLLRLSVTTVSTAKVHGWTDQAVTWGVGV